MEFKYLFDILYCNFDENYFCPRAQIMITCTNHPSPPLIISIMSSKLNYASPPPSYQKTVSSPELGYTIEKRKVYKNKIKKRSSSLKYLAVSMVMSFLLISSLFYYFIINPIFFNKNEIHIQASNQPTAHGQMLKTEKALDHLISTSSKTEVKDKERTKENKASENVSEEQEQDTQSKDKEKDKYKDHEEEEKTNGGDGKPSSPIPLPSNLPPNNSTNYSTEPKQMMPTYALPTITTPGNTAPPSNNTTPPSSPSNNTTPPSPPQNITNPPLQQKQVTKKITPEVIPEDPLITLSTYSSDSELLSSSTTNIVTDPPLVTHVPNPDPDA